MRPGRSVPVRLAALALAVGLAATGCGGGGDAPAAEGTSGASSTPASGSASESDTGSGTARSDGSPSPTTDVEVPAGVTLTEPGAELSFGDTARVPYQVTRPAPSRPDGGKGGSKAEQDREATVGTVLALTIDSATKGALADLAGFNLTDPYQRRANYYYVRVTVGNVGTTRLGDVDVPLWGISGENTLLPPVEFTSAFSRCPTRALPPGFAPGKRFSTCLVFLSPDKCTLEGVSFRPTEQSIPIEWRGEVAPPRQGRRGTGDGG